MFCIYMNLSACAAGRCDCQLSELHVFKMRYLPNLLVFLRKCPGRENRVTMHISMFDNRLLYA